MDGSHFSVGEKTLIEEMGVCVVLSIGMDN